MRWLAIFIAAVLCGCADVPAHFRTDRHGNRSVLLAAGRGTHGKIISAGLQFCRPNGKILWSSPDISPFGYVFATDTTSDDPLIALLSASSPGDSGLAYLKPASLRNPLFVQIVQALNDTSVTVRYRVRALRVEDPANAERAFIRRRCPDCAEDEHGVFWVSTPPATPAQDTKYPVSYRGSFLDGRGFDVQQDFGFEAGVPDQLQPGLNIVIRRIGAGANAKIILPSRLAFGPDGSAGGVVPPYTPVLYEVTTGSSKN